MTPVPLPPASLFTHPSEIHGVGHVGRVMVHAMRLVDATGLEHERRCLKAAVFLHDIARTHDGWCPVHGQAAVRRWQNESAVQAAMAPFELSDVESAAVANAVALHCVPDRAPLKTMRQFSPLLSLLKDADALDRVRLFSGVDVAQLRFLRAFKMVTFAEKLFKATEALDPDVDPSQVFWVADRLLTP